MAEFILEEQIKNVINKNTKEYLKEVISCYNSGNYRATVVVLYTVLIYDLIQKLVILKEIYNDKGAEKILNDIKKRQSENPRSPEWEGNLIESVCKETRIISEVEKEELLYLKNQRNYAAHPIVNVDVDNEVLELKQITKETACDLIRKAFEIVFLRDAILAKNIVQDIILDLNQYYERVKIDGLEKFLSTKYFQRMTQERKNYLFKSLWKFVFIISNDDCDKNRESNYWGLVYLYNENKEYYQNLIKRDENYYFDKLQLETVSSWNNEKSYAIRLDTISNFKLRSRIIHLIKFLEYAPEMYKKLNNYAKNIIRQSIDHMYTDADIVEKPIYQIANTYKDLISEQIQLKSNAVFTSDTVTQHFEMIFKMINNYINTAHDWTDLDKYGILTDKDLGNIFTQCEYRGCTEEFLKFLIKYCMGAKQYWQAPQLFNYIKQYKTYLKKEHYFMILTGMNSNPQYYDNKGIMNILKDLENMYIDSFGVELVKEKEEQYLYNKLYHFDFKGLNVEKVLTLIEERATYYSVWDLWELILNLDNIHHLEFLKEQKISSFPNIMRTLGNENDPGYKAMYVTKFREYFV